MSASDMMTQLGRRGRFGLAFLFAASFLAGQRLVATAQTLSPPRACQIADDVVAAQLLDQWAEAIKSEHPDHITKLYQSDASFEGLASPVPRTTYPTIREYYLYYLQFAPQIRFEERQLETGCNYLISTGNYSWLLKTRDAATGAAVSARFRFVFEHNGSQWQIGEHIEESTDPDGLDSSFLVPAPSAQLQSPAIIASTNGPAVAGYLKRLPVDERQQRHREQASTAGAAARLRPTEAAPATQERRWESDVFQSLQ